MAEKEERILITTRHKNEKLNMTFTDMYKEYTRQEAIECMARALHKYEFTYSPVPMPTWCELNDDVKNDYRKMAEAALNALLNN